MFILGHSDDFNLQKKEYYKIHNMKCISLLLYGDIDRYNSEKINWIRIVIFPSKCDIYPSKLFNHHTGERFSLIKYDGDIIISDKYYLYDIETIKKFNFEIDKTYIYNLCSLGKVDTLEYLHKKNKIKGLNLSITPYISFMDIASNHGHIHVLEWWFQSNLPVIYSAHSLDTASVNDHVNVLDWWLNSSLKLKYTENASSNSFSVYLGLKYSSDALDMASAKGHVNVLNWWLNSGLELKYTEKALDYASWNGHVNVLDWWKNSGLKVKWSEITRKNILKKKGKCIKESHQYHQSIIQWWKTVCLEDEPFENKFQYEALS
jgi:hypothetical protein